MRVGLLCIKWKLLVMNYYKDLTDAMFTYYLLKPIGS